MGKVAPMKWSRNIFRGMSIVVVLATAQFAHAILGENADTIASDRKTLAAVHKASTPRRGYTVEEMASESTAVREYVSPSGVVFGIAWNGIVHPDLTQLLGSYSGEYTAALREAPRTQGRRSRRLVTDNVVVETWGHMRNLRGRAYAPNLVPGGVRIDEIE
jgi:hypothetical protein